METITIEYHPDSLERFSQNGRILHKIGVGRMKSPGHPAGNQQSYSQAAFFSSVARQIRFPVFYKKKNNSLTYMGEYILMKYSKKESFEGFTYFSYTLHRAQKDFKG